MNYNDFILPGLKPSGQNSDLTFLNPSVNHFIDLVFDRPDQKPFGHSGTKTSDTPLVNHLFAETVFDIFNFTASLNFRPVSV